MIRTTSLRACYSVLRYSITPLSLLERIRGEGHFTVLDRVFRGFDDCLGTYRSDAL